MPMRGCIAIKLTASKSGIDALNMEAVRALEKTTIARAGRKGPPHKKQDGANQLDPAGAEVDTGRDQAQRHQQPGAAKQCNRLGRTVARAHHASRIHRSDRNHAHKNPLLLALKYIGPARF